MKELSIDVFQELMMQNVPVVDTRNMNQLRDGFIKGSIVIPELEKFKEYAGHFLNNISPKGRPEVLLICNEEERQNWINEIEKSDYRVAGFMQGGFEAWEEAGKPIDFIIEVEPDELMMDIPFDDNLVVMDVRPAISFADGHLKEAVSLPLSVLNDPLRIAAIEDQDNIYLVGNSDEEQVTAATILKKHDIHNLRVVLGGWDAVAAQPKAKIVKDPETLN